jgi:hypothetical protein
MIGRLFFGLLWDDFNSGYNINQHLMSNELQQKIISTAFAPAFARFISLIVFLLLICLQGVMKAWAVVTIDEFIASAVGETVLLEWRTISETGNAGFYIQRSNQEGGPFLRISPYFESLVQDGVGEEYFWFDITAEPGIVYYYRLEAIDDQGISQFFGPIPGSINEGLITATFANAQTPTRTPTPPGISATGAATATGATPTATRAAVSTGMLPSPTTPGITSTPTPDVTLTAFAELGITLTPTMTSTLEPLPSIELLFPATMTPEPVSAASQPQLHAEAPTVLTAVVEVRGPFGLSNRLLALFGIVGALWLVLGALLVFLVRKLNNQ